MPTMFSSRRHAPPAQPLTRETANPNAATAAASAFMRRDSNASLSSAAAAAALRARPQTPTNVAEVQTKRAHRRSPSASSQASRDRLPVCERQRSPSVGSMMERTFRSPSPHRSPARRDGHVPPVPSLPSVGDLEPAAAQPLLQTHPFRTASDRMKRGHHGAWFGAAAGGDPANVRRSDAVVASAPEPRPGSVSPSINFSYPRARAQSSPSPADDQTPVYDANSRRMVPRGELLARAQSMYEPTPRQKKRQEPNRSASHLSRGNVATTQTPALQQPQARPAQQQAVADTEMRPAVAPEPPREPDKQTAKKKKKRQQQQQVGGSRSAPSGEPEQGRDAASSTQPSLSKKPNMEAHGNLENSHRPPKPTPSDVTTDSGPKVMAAEAQVSSPEPLRPGSSGRLARESSESPARSARFASAPDQLLVRHEPPPRSVSPKKSAMKLPSQRDASPSDDGSEASEPRRTSEIQDAAAARKRSVRVSWDDRSTVVGEASEPHGAEPPFAPSPQTKKPWHSIVTKYAKKDQVNLSQDETMTPRPALPLFGSVREKKAREVEERPLVRPSERARSSSAAESSATGPPAELGQSSDAAVGAVVAQDQTSRNAANISKYREPPPVALAPGESSAKESTLVESSSDDDLDIDATTEPDDATEPKLAPGKAPEGQTPESARRAGDEGGTNLDVCGAVPTISVSLPSPGLEEPQQGRDGGDGPKVPGQSPENDNAANGGENPGVKTPAEPTSQGATSSRSAEPPSVVANAAMADIKEEEEEESDRCSVYSDAYEDLEDVDGDGFLSLDAVVEGSAEKKTPILSQEQPAASRLDRVEHSAGSPALSKQGKLSSKQADNWENAKAYWRSLSADQRRLLEMEALSDASDEEEDGPRRAQEGRATTARSEEAPQHSPAVNGRSHQIKSETTWSGDHNSDEQVPAQPSKATPKFRRSMRGEQPGSTARAVDEQHGVLRKSMRTGRPAPAAVSAENTGRGGHHDTDTQATASVAGAGTRATIGNRGCDDDDGGIRPLLSRTGRPASYHPPETTRAHKARKRNLSVEDFRGPGDTGPGLRRQRSDDSVSSFTRSRPSPGTAHGFRKSMRTSKQDWTSPGAAKARGRFSLRSMSPPAFRRNSSTSLPGSPVPSSGGGRMRLSMRSDAKPRTWRSPFKRSPGEKKGGGSRFADSSDDEKAPRPRSRGKGLSRSLRGGADGASGAASVHDATARPQQGSDGAEHAAGLRRSGSGRGTLTPLPARAPGPDGGGDGNDDDDDDDPRPAVDRPRPSTAGGPAGNPRARTMAFHRRNTSLPQQQQHKKKKFGALRKMFGIHN